MVNQATRQYMSSVAEMGFVRLSRSQQIGFECKARLWALHRRISGGEDDRHDTLTCVPSSMQVLFAVLEIPRTNRSSG